MLSAHQINKFVTNVIENIWSKNLGFSSYVLLFFLAILAIAGAVFYSQVIQKSQQPTTPSQPPKRLAILVAGNPMLSVVDGIKDGLKELGYNEGKEVVYELKNPKGDNELMKKMAQEMVASKPDLLVSVSTSATTTLQEANKETGLPSVFVDVQNIQKLNIKSFDKPGGLRTGVVADNVRLLEKRMEILKELLPRAKIFATIGDPSHGNYQTEKEAYQKAAEILGVKFRTYDAKNNDEVKQALALISKDQPDGFLVSNQTLISNNHQVIADGLKKAKIPSIDSNAEFGIDVGYLLMFGFYRYETGKQGAVLIDKVLKGQDPGEIPIEFSKNPNLEINLVTAEEIGLSMPETFLSRAKRVKQ